VKKYEEKLRHYFIKEYDIALYFSRDI